MTSYKDQDALVKYALIGAGSIAVAGLALYLMRGKGINTAQCLKEIDALGPVKRQANGNLEFTYYKDIFLIISKNAK